MQASSSVSALTDCTRASNDDAVMKPIKFNDLARIGKLVIEAGSRNRK
jgi:hypothetical protein